MDSTHAGSFPTSRRENRIQMPRGSALNTNGHIVQLVDLSHRGAQILSSRVLRPNEVVRINAPIGSANLPLRGTVAWSSFELVAGQARYRAGIEFEAAAASTIQQYFTEILAACGPTRTERRVA